MEEGQVTVCATNRNNHRCMYMIVPYSKMQGLQWSFSHPFLPKDPDYFHLDVQMWRKSRIVEHDTIVDS